MNKYDVVIGIEIHIELNTKTKMFSSAPNVFGDTPNTNVSVVDIAYPGTLPSPNKQAIIKAIKLGKALNMEIDNLLRFDRKHYFYPDLPKGYQITQEKYPIGKNGIIPIFNGESTIEIERIQLEEDTAKSTHTDAGTLLDYNRAGVPLIEIITGPVMTGAEDATEYVREMRRLVSFIGISDAKMEEGSFRADVNISLKPKDTDVLGTKVEIKNINTIKNINSAILNEIKEQTELLDTNKPVLQATKRFDENTQTNITMRVKTDAVVYRFLPEPNINPITLSNEFIASVDAEELPWEKLAKYNNDGIDPKNSQRLVDNKDYYEFFDLVKINNRKKLSNVFFSEIVSLANSENKTISELNIEPIELALAIQKVEDGEISGKHLKTIVPLLMDKQSTVEEIVSKNNMKMISDETEINALIDIAIKDNMDFIKSNIDRQDKVIKYIIGNIMKTSRGQASPQALNKLVKPKIEELDV